MEWTHAERAAGRYVCFGVVPDGQDSAVGIFQLHRLDPGFVAGEWGFILGQPYWGSGLFAEGARLLLEFAFKTVGVKRLEARAALANVRGNGALRKMGAVREGCLRRSFLLGGEYFDDALWSILEEDWRRDRATRVSGRLRAAPGRTEGPTGDAALPAHARPRLTVV